MVSELRNFCGSGVAFLAKGSFLMSHLVLQMLQRKSLLISET